MTDDPDLPELVWGLRIGNGDVIPLAEAGSRYTIFRGALRVREGDGQWRVPTEEEFRYLRPWGTPVADPR